MSRGSTTAVWLTVATAVMLVAGLPLAAATHQFGGGGIVQFAILLPFAAVGGIVARRRPDNPIGWLMLGTAFIGAVSDIAGWYAVLAYRYGHPGLPLARLGVVLAPIGWFLLLLVLPLVILLFPSGRPPTRRWRWPSVLYLGIWAVVIGSATVVNLNWALTGGTPTIDSTGELEIFDHSTGWFGGVIGVAVPFYGILGSSFVVAQVLAYRRSRGELRQQLKWLMTGGGLCVAGVTFSLVFGSAASAVVRVVSVFGYFGVVAVPVSVGVGILKYRLFDVDRLISRTLSYALLTGALLLVFFGIVLLATRVLPFSSPVGVAASTLAAAALFNPLRRRLQRGVDRRFNRARYDAEAIVAGFSTQLRGAVDLEAVRDELLVAVDRAIEPTHASLWLRRP
jgi:hypothetical protein